MIVLKSPYASDVELTVEHYPLGVTLRGKPSGSTVQGCSIELTLEDLLDMLHGTDQELRKQCQHFTSLLQMVREIKSTSDLVATGRPQPPPY